MGTIKNAELSMKSVRRLLERNHLAYTIKKDAILFNRRFNRRTGQKSYYYIGFTEGGLKIGRQNIVFGSVDYDVYDEDDFAMEVCFRNAMCTDMAFFAFHFHDLFPNFYPIDEYNDWNK
ncbi:MAG: hypothetical protein MR292_00690 [Alistipes sp.]|nr:hypothetical protein [Alistipes sp.]